MALFGVLCRECFYFAVWLTFDCRSSPNIFDSLSEAICWICINNYKLPYILHLLNGFLVITPKSSPQKFSLSTLIKVLSDHGMPLSEEKTLGPRIYIEHPGITIDSISCQASLPLNKVQCITLLLPNYILGERCTKQQLLALIGHLNYAIRIIP